MRPLTDRMWIALDRLAKPKAYARYMPYMGRFNENPYWFICDEAGGLASCTAAINGLIKRGLVEECNREWNGHDGKITPLGRKALRDRQKAPT